MNRYIGVVSSYSMETLRKMLLIHWMLRFLHLQHTSNSITYYMLLWIVINNYYMSDKVAFERKQCTTIRNLIYYYTLLIVQAAFKVHSVLRHCAPPLLQICSIPQCLALLHSLSYSSIALSICGGQVTTLESLYQAFEAQVISINRLLQINPSV